MHILFVSALKYLALKFCSGMHINQGQCMTALIEEENLDEDSNIQVGRLNKHWKSKWKLKPCKSTATISDEADKDKDDGNYSASDSDGQSDSSESDVDSNVEMVSNDEVCIPQLSVWVTNCSSSLPTCSLRKPLLKYSAQSQHHQRRNHAKWKPCVN